MKILPPDLEASLLSGVTTLCRCWRLQRVDGLVLGFTDHDRDLAFDGVTYEAEAGMTASAINATGALNIDTTDISGALQSDHLNEADLAGGLYDNAALTLFVVDWSAPENRDILFAGSIGEVSRGRTGFTCEMRGLSHALNQPVGRLYQRCCDADLGDDRCGVDLGSPANTGAGTVTAATSNSTFLASGLTGFAEGRFDRGRLVWISGENRGAAMEVKFHTRDDVHTSFTLWETMPYDIAPGDAFNVAAGCDKSTESCAAKFGNIANFRGFPFLPGNDILTSYPGRTGNDKGGGSQWQSEK
ncbi:DUF2163 domain-containing protein [Rhodopseudomonas palustris]|uniref:DUF2163 domain-containing protein n=1 Tax=Rhodopseudomonas palustris TaxID=1076 RepID=A0A418V456_RHOPL|nr:DUF2163 domain-containing protein [Rhodopseudomonas palustris]RJF70863.1 DUF2163 domain-containing protein [Rhodopseudomonas palustris]